MPPDPGHAVTLICHPEIPTHAVRGIAARVPRKRGRRLAVTCVLECDLDRLPAPYPGAPLSLALSAVIEDSDGVLSYWALRRSPANRISLIRRHSPSSQEFARQKLAAQTP